MEIKIAKNAGYCFGVKRAVQLVEDLLESNGGKIVYSLGALIHNPQAIAKLEEKGFKIVESFQEIPENSTFVIRSHGTTKEVEKDAEMKGLEVIDTTCPFVKKAQQAAEELFKEGRQVVIVGDPKHAEVVGINSRADNLAIIIKEPEELEKYKIEERVGVMAQTTQKRKRFEMVVKKLKEKASDIEIRDTICSATKVKQNEVKKLARKADLIIVVGGKDSSNTTKLAQIATEEGAETYHIETAEELKEEWLENKKTVGIAAGASTPQFLIDEVLGKIKKGPSF